MALVKISDLVDGAPIDGTEDLEMVQGGVSKRCSTQDIADLAIRTVKLSLTSAQILALNTTPITIVPAQGANTFIMPVAVIYKYNFVSTGYSTNVSVALSEGASFPSLTTTANVLSPTSNTLFPKSIASNAGAGSYTLNQPLQVTVPVGNPTGGDSTLDVYVSFIVYDLV